MAVGLGEGGGGLLGANLCPFFQKSKIKNNKKLGKTK